jgi:hypothetical protein
MKTLDTYPLAELKLIYRALHSQLTHNPDLLDSALLHDLQTHLQREARGAGVVATDHAQWDAWLNAAENTR